MPAERVDAPPVDAVDAVDAVVIGAGQAGLSASYLLARSGVHHVLLDAGAGAGGAWAQRWPTLTMARVNGVHDLPGAPLGDVDPGARASDVVAAYFADYERRWRLPVVRPVTVRAVGRSPSSDRLVVRAADGRTWAARAVLNATGTWTRPFWPAYPGRERFAGRQLHARDYRGPGAFTGARVVVVGGGVSAVQLLLEVHAVAAATLWVTRRPPVFADEASFDVAARRAAVARVAARVEAGEPPGSVVSATGLVWTSQLRGAARDGVLVRWPVMDRLVPDGVAWDAPVGPGGARRWAADAVLWCTGFRPALDHLAPLHLRAPGGGVRVTGSRSVDEPRLWLLGHGPSASTVGASRAARTAVREVRALLANA